MLLHCGSCAVTSAGVKPTKIVTIVTSLCIVPPRTRLYRIAPSPGSAPGQRSANFTPCVPERTSPMIHAAMPARLAEAITASVSSRAATAIIPTPRLKTRRISPSDTSPARIDHGFTCRGQDAHQVAGDAAARDVRHRVQAWQDGRDGREVALVYVQQ